MNWGLKIRSRSFFILIDLSCLGLFVKGRVDAIVKSVDYSIHYLLHFVDLVDVCFMHGFSEDVLELS